VVDTHTLLVARTTMGALPPLKIMFAHFSNVVCATIYYLWFVCCGFSIFTMCTYISDVLYTVHMYVALYVCGVCCINFIIKISLTCFKVLSRGGALQ
jgi:hypothetical protein